MTSALDSCAGSITVELYEAGPDFSGSDGDETDCPSCGTMSSSESQPKNAEGPAEFKTYDFQHYDLAKETLEADELSGALQYFSDTARNAFNHHYTISNHEYMEALLHPKGSFPRCPKGDTVEEPYFRRKHPGPFLTCCFGHSHECGDEFGKMPVNTKPIPSSALSYRPHHLRERKAKFYKPCKNCETIPFVHHRNPAQHYEDYLNNVTYKSHKNHIKVWPQHLADLKKVLEDNEEEASKLDLTEISSKCKDYRPSTVAAQASRYSYTFKKKKVIARKRTPLQRPLRRPSSKSSNTTKFSGNLRGRSRDQKRKEPLFNARQSPYAPARATLKTPKNSASFRNAKSTRLMETKQNSEAQSVRSSPDTSPIPEASKANRTSGASRNYRPKSALQRTIRASVARLIKSHKSGANNSSKSKQSVKKQKPRKTSKYIQKVKPNISAKFLRAKSKGKAFNWKPSGMSTPPSGKNRGKGNQQREDGVEQKRILKVLKKPVSKLAKSKSGSKESSRSSSRDSFTSNSDEEDDDDEENKRNYGDGEPDEISKSERGSYSKFRDRNGEFDTEKYRRSILKMLAKHSGTGAKRERKKQKDRSSSQTSSNFAALPKIKNVYDNIKSKTVSNVPKRKRKKQSKKSKNDALLEISNISSRSKYALEERDSYFSIPSLDDVKI